MGWCASIKVRDSRREAEAFGSLPRLDRRVPHQAGLLHLAAAILFMWQTAAVSETARILPDHINLQERLILLETTKTGEWEIRHISRELMIRIANLPTQNGEPLFGYASRFGIRARMKAVCRRAGIPFVPPPSGRAT
jgi:integrase